MQITIELIPEEEAALNHVAAKAGTPAKPAVPETEASPGSPAVPAVVVAPEDYLRARVADLLGSYADQMRAEDSRLVVEAFKTAPEADRQAVFAALKLERTAVATES